MYKEEVKEVVSVIIISVKMYLLLKVYLPTVATKRRT